MHEGHRERLRNKMINSPESLEPHEVLEVLLFYCIPRKNVNEIAHELLKRSNGSIKGVLQSDMQVLAGIKGIGENTACFLKTINKICEYIKAEESVVEKITCPFDAKKEAKKIFENANKELFAIIYLSANGNVLGKTVITSNKQDRVELDLNDIGRQIFIHKPKTVLIAHNHISENVNPSRADDEATKKIGAFLSLSGVCFYDHIIFGLSGNTYSYHAEGRLDELLSQVEKVFF